MSSCAVNRWGPGTTCKKTTQNSESVKEMTERIAKMQAERDRQDTMWKQEEKEEKEEKKPEKNCNTK
jgi:hypothetical protein